VGDSDIILHTEVVVTISYGWWVVVIV